MTDLSPQALAWVRSQIDPAKPFIHLNSGYTGPSPRSVGAADPGLDEGLVREGSHHPPGGGRAAPGNRRCPWRRVPPSPDFSPFT
jgi:hypothetical protein